MKPTTILTLDFDWAPDFVLDFVRTKLEEKKAHATLFVTHASTSLAAWKSNPDFELGWHPNFLSNSSQGKDPHSVAEYLKTIVPGAKSMRSHDLFFATSIFKRFLASAPELRYDSSLYLPEQTEINAFDLDFGFPQKLKRFPFVFEDDLHLLEGKSLEIPHLKWSQLDFCILNFHPIHIYLNTFDFNAYLEVRDLGPMQDLTPQQIEPFRHLGTGIDTLFTQALETLTFPMTLAEFADQN